MLTKASKIITQRKQFLQTSSQLTSRAVLEMAANSEIKTRKRKLHKVAVFIWLMMEIRWFMSMISIVRNQVIGL